MITPVNDGPANAGLFFEKLAELSGAMDSLSEPLDCHRLEPSEAKAHFQCSKSEQESATKKHQFFWTLGHGSAGKARKKR